MRVPLELCSASVAQETRKPAGDALDVGSGRARAPPSASSFARHLGCRGNGGIISEILQEVVKGV